MILGQGPLWGASRNPAKVNLNFLCIYHIIQYIIDYYLFSFVLVYVYKKSPSFPQASTLPCYNYSYNYWLLDPSHCPTRFFTLRRSWVLVRSGLHWTSQTCWQCSWELPVAPFLWGMSTCNSAIPFSEVCLHVVVPGGLSVLKFFVMLFTFSFTIYCLSSGNNSHSSIFSINLRSKAVGFLCVHWVSHKLCSRIYGFWHRP